MHVSDSHLLPRLADASLLVMVRGGGAIRAISSSLVIQESSFTRCSAGPFDGDFDSCALSFGTSTSLCTDGLGGVISTEMSPLIGQTLLHARDFERDRSLRLVFVVVLLNVRFVRCDDVVSLWCAAVMFSSFTDSRASDRRAETFVRSAVSASLRWWLSLQHNLSAIFVCFPLLPCLNVTATDAPAARECFNSAQQLRQGRARARVIVLAAS